MKKFIYLLVVLLLVFCGIFWLRFLSPEDAWVCGDNGWVKHGNPSSPTPNTRCPAVQDPIKSEPLTTSTQTINPNPPAPSSTTEVLPKEFSVNGLYVCLPKLGNGPQTTECALGIMTDDGIYYSLDTNKLGTYLEFPTGTRLHVSGIYTPIEMISSNLGKIYPVKGIISIEKVREIE